ncbi:DUF5324 family protein [Streptacidiphilus cavernicola]|uniref:DUF5324 family protein n=1 Tax=Streptacidiphilus cavernicola TaxID=3342716 RepID=A0ABV6VV32_9ACTN
MTRIDAAREAAGKTREQLAPYAASARDAAAHYTDEAWQRLAPHVGSAVEQARVAALTAQQAAQHTVDSRVAPRVAPLWDQAVGSLPPSVEDAVARAAVRTRRAARQARRTAVPAVAHAFDEASHATALAAQAARERGAATLPVLRGQVSLAEIEALAAKHSRSRRSRWGRRLVVLGTLGLLAGGGLAAWKWWEKQSNPDWLVEPPSTPLPPRSTPAGATSSTMPLDPEVRAKQAAEAKQAEQAARAKKAARAKDVAEDAEELGDPADDA